MIQYILTPKAAGLIQPILLPNILQRILDTFENRPAPRLNGCVQFVRFSVGDDQLAGTVIRRRGHLTVVIVPQDDPCALKLCEAN